MHGFSLQQLGSGQVRSFFSFEFMCILFLDCLCGGSAEKARSSTYACMYLCRPYMYVNICDRQIWKTHAGSMAIGKDARDSVHRPMACVPKFLLCARATRCSTEYLDSVNETPVHCPLSRGRPQPRGGLAQRPPSGQLQLSTRLHPYIHMYILNSCVNSLHERPHRNPTTHSPPSGSRPLQHTLSRSAATSQSPSVVSRHQHLALWTALPAAWTRWPSTT